MSAETFKNIFRQLFKTNDNPKNIQDERNRKRRFENQEPLAQNSFAKYRKVSNKFPKHYPVRTYEHDNLYLIRTNSSSKANYLPPNQSSHFSMNNRFNGKKPAQDNSPYAEIEFSDEEDEDGFTASRFPTHTVFPSSSVQPSTSRRSFASMNQPSQIPGLYPINSNTFLANSVRQAEINRTNQRFYNSNSFGLPPVALPHDQPTRRKSSLFTKIKKPFANAFTPKPNFNSVLNSNVNMDSKREYQSLLDRVAPNLFGRKSRLEPVPPLKPLSQNIPVVDLLDDDSDEPEEVVTLSFQQNNRNRRSSASNFKTPTVLLDLTDDEDDKNFNRRRSVPTGRRQSLLSSTLIDLDPKRKMDSESNLHTTIEKKSESLVLPTVEPVNTLLDKMQSRSFFHQDIINSITQRYAEVHKKRSEEIQSEKQNVTNYHQQRRENEYEITNKLRDFAISAETIVLDEEEPEEEINEFPDFTPENLSNIRAALSGNRSAVVVNKFNMQITRQDLFTLVGESWLNDEVINFYMNLLIERSELGQSMGLPKVYAMNTFFIPRLLQAGHSGVKRWTKKVDIFSYDLIPVPVHVGQVHWCMAIIHMREKTIKYYDSMGNTNPRVLEALEQYLKDESLDKRKTPFDTTGWKNECVKDCPRQMNGSDCGVFSCMTAEFFSRGSPITFSQQHMQHFRNKMILEISTGKMLL